jgi:hypothetical protein
MYLSLWGIKLGFMLFTVMKTEIQVTLIAYWVKSHVRFEVFIALTADSIVLYEVEPILWHLFITFSATIHKMEVKVISKFLVSIYQTTLCHIPEKNNVHELQKSILADKRLLKHFLLLFLLAIRITQIL